MGVYALQLCFPISINADFRLANGVFMEDVCCMVLARILFIWLEAYVSQNSKVKEKKARLSSC